MPGHVRSLLLSGKWQEISARGARNLRSRAGFLNLVLDPVRPLNGHVIMELEAWPMNRLSLWQNALVIPLQRTTGAPPPPAPMALQGVTVAPKLCPSPWIQGTPLLNRFWKTMPLVASTDCVHTRSQTHAACTGHRGPSHGGAARAYDKLHPHALRALHYQATSKLPLAIAKLPSGHHQTTTKPPVATTEPPPSLLWPPPSTLSPLPSHISPLRRPLSPLPSHYQTLF